jgi:hypothetical protein
MSLPPTINSVTVASPREENTPFFFGTSYRRTTDKHIEWAKHVLCWLRHSQLQQDPNGRKQARCINGSHGRIRSVGRRPPVAPSDVSAALAMRQCNLPSRRHNFGGGARGGTLSARGGVVSAGSGTIVDGSRLRGEG